MKKIIIDLDSTLTVAAENELYENRKPNTEVVKRLIEYKSLGYTIVVFTSRNMRTYEGNIGKINIYTLPLVLDWLKRHEIPFDEVIVGKPWCGHDGFYVDDRAVRPNEFADLSPDKLAKLLST
jgi:capsule biosynthesis phosphatase